jgi:hypothetical protein
MKRVANIWLWMAIIDSLYCGVWKGYEEKDYLLITLLLVIHYGENLIYYITKEK